MKFYKKVIIALLFNLICINISFGIEPSILGKSDKALEENTFQTILTPPEAQKKNIEQYIKKHNKEQNLELFLTWREDVISSFHKSNHISLYEASHNEQVLKTLQNQVSKTNLCLKLLYGNYELAIDYPNVYKLWGKYLPDDWKQYLQNLATEDNYSENNLLNNEQNLVMWESFANKYPDFEEIYVVYKKMKKYENRYFGYDTLKNSRSNVFKDEVITAYDKFSDKYPNSKYAPLCTRLSNLKKLKHDFVSPYKEKLLLIRDYMAQNTDFQLAHDYVKRKAILVYDLTNKNWYQYSDDYIRGNYIFVLSEEQGQYKLYNKKYIEISSIDVTDSNKLENVFLKNNRLFVVDKTSLKIQEIKFNDLKNEIIYEDINKLTLSELNKDKKIIYVSSLSKAKNGDYIITIKNKKYPMNFILYNDTENSYVEYAFVDNSDVKFINNLEFEVKSKTMLTLEPIKNFANEDIQPTNETAINDVEVLPIYKFIFE